MRNALGRVGPGYEIHAKTNQEQKDKSCEYREALQDAEMTLRHSGVAPLRRRRRARSGLSARP